MTNRVLNTRQSGLTYIEVMIAAVLIVLALIPAMEALHTGVLGREVFETSADEHYRVLGRMETVLAEPFSALVSTAAAAGDEATPSAYSDSPGPADRLVVYVALYDANDADGDGDVFTVLDPDIDGDANPYTDYAGLLWARAGVQGSITALESLVAP